MFNLKNRLYWVGVSLLLSSGCAVNTPAVDVVEASKSNATEDARPSVPLDVYEDPYFQLLLGELSGQQGQLAQSVLAYREAMLNSDDPRVAQRTVEIASYAGVGEVAWQAANRWAKLSPNDPTAQLTAGLWAMRLDREPEAVEFLDAFVRQYPDGQVEAFLDLANGMRRESPPKAAVSIFTKLTERHDDLPQAHYALAVSALQSGQAEIAIAAATQALTKQPDFHAATLLAAQASFQADDQEAGLKILTDAVGRYPRELPLRLALAQLLLRADRADESEAAYKRVLGLDPKQPEALFALGLLALDDKRLDAGRYYFGQLWESGQQRDAAAFYQGLIAEQAALASKPEEADFATALSWFRQVLDGDQMIEAQYRIGKVLAAEGDIEGARTHFLDARRRLPESAVQFWLGEGELLFNLGEYEQCYSLYNKALEEFPKDTDLLYARALAAEKIGRVMQTELDLRKILEQRPDDPVVLNALGYTLADRTDRQAEALDLIEQALELAPDKPFIIDSMGWVLYKLGQHERALSYLQRAYEMLRDPEVAAHLGEVLWVTGDKQKARSVLTEASAEHPDFSGEVIRRAIDRLTP